VFPQKAHILNKFSDIPINQVTINHESELVVTELDADHHKLIGILEINIPTGQLPICTKIFSFDSKSIYCKETNQ